MNTRSLLPFAALLPLTATASAADARERGVDRIEVAAPSSPRALDKAHLVGSWDIVADQGGCQRTVTVGEDHTIAFADGVGIGTWALHGETVQINALHAKMPVAQTGLAAEKHVKVRWNGELRRGAEGKLSGELVIEVLDRSGRIKSSRRSKFTASKA